MHSHPVRPSMTILPRDSNAPIVLFPPDVRVLPMVLGMPGMTVDPSLSKVRFRQGHF